jgi:hypothetical protein
MTVSAESGSAPPAKNGHRPWPVAGDYVGTKEKNI